LKVICITYPDFVILKAQKSENYIYYYISHQEKEKKVYFYFLLLMAGQKPVNEAERN